MTYNPPEGSIYHLYTTYILPSGGLYATYHLLGEPETTIDYVWLCDFSSVIEILGALLFMWRNNPGSFDCGI